MDETFAAPHGIEIVAIDPKGVTTEKRVRVYNSRPQTVCLQIRGHQSNRAGQQCKTFLLANAQLDLSEAKLLIALLTNAVKEAES